MSSNNNVRIAKNTMMLYLRMMLLMAVSLYTSRIVLNSLGVEDYGIYNIVGGVIILFSFFNNAMSNATLRFLAFDLGKENFTQLKRTFSMSLNVHFSIALLILVLAETIGLWFLNTQLNIPPGRMDAANWVYQFSIATFILDIIRVPFHSIIIAHEKMSFYAYLSIVEGLLKLGVVFLLQVFAFDKLAFYGFLIFTVSLITLLTYVFYCLKSFNTSRYHFFWDKQLFMRLIGFSGWTLFGSVANVGSKQGTNILLNIFYGVTVNAAMGIANQVNNAINGFVQNFQTAFRPQIVKSYAIGDKQYLMQLITQTSKFSFFLLYFISLPILLNTEMVLQLWLKNVPEYAIDFVRLIIIYSLLESISGPLWMTVQATGNIRKYQLIISSLILSNLWISYIFLKIGYSPIYVLYIRIVINIFCLVYRILYLKNENLLYLKHFLSNVLVIVFLVVVASFFFPLIIRLHSSGIKGLFLTTTSSIINVGLTIYFIGLTKNEKKYFQSLIHTRLNINNLNFLKFNR